MARGYCCASLVMLSEFLLWASAVGLALAGYILTQRDIIALVTVTIPQVAIGLGILTLIIAIWGRLSDYRRWQCGFYIMAIALIMLFLAEILVVGYSQLQYSERDNKADLWNDLSSDGQAVLQSNYKCCDWDPVCPATSTSVYRAYRTSCKDATATDYKDWVMLITIIFASAAGFHLIYTCIPCLAQAKRLQMKREKQNEANKKEVKEALSKQKPNNSPRGSWFFRSKQKSAAEQEIRAADMNAPQVVQPTPQPTPQALMPATRAQMGGRSPSVGTLSTGV